MAELYLEQFDVEIPDAVWRNITLPQWNGTLRMKLRPYTQPLRDVVLQRAKRNPLSNRHQVTIDGETQTIDGDETTANNVEFLDAVIEAWEGVAGDPPCTRENKIKVRVSQMLVVYLINLTNAMAGVQVADEEKNS